MSISWPSCAMYALQAKLVRGAEDWRQAGEWRSGSGWNQPCDLQATEGIVRLDPQSPCPMAALLDLPADRIGE
ncbi:MAG: hypothetical protein AABY96_06460 [Nitrospirota bacterium]